MDKAKGAVRRVGRRALFETWADEDESTVILETPAFFTTLTATEARALAEELVMRANYVDQRRPAPHCAVGTGASHRPHAYYDDGDTVTCSGWTEPADPGSGEHGE